MKKQKTISKGFCCHHQAGYCQQKQLAPSPDHPWSVKGSWLFFSLAWGMLLSRLALLFLWKYCKSPLARAEQPAEEGKPPR